MNDSILVQAYLLGIMSMLAIFLTLERLNMLISSYAKRAGALFAAASGILVTLYLHDDPVLLKEIVKSNVELILAILIAFLILLKRS